MNRAEWLSRTSLVYIFFLSIISYSALGQHNPIQPIINYSHKEYRAGSQNWGITQNHHGVLFFANNDGLLSYDGQEWQLQQVPNYTIIRSICYYNERIYVGAEGEFGSFAPNLQGILSLSMECFNLGLTPGTKSSKQIGSTTAVNFAMDEWHLGPSLGVCS